MTDGSLNSTFPETRWTMVLALRHGGDTTLGCRALEELCQMYWKPLYGYARCLGNSPEDSEDLTQGFFEQVVKTEMLTTANESVGKLRAFLRKSFSNHIRNMHRAANGKRRGGGFAVVSMESLQPLELELEAGAQNNDSPDAAYDRLCALALVEGTLAELQTEYDRSGKGEVFAAFRPHLDPQRSDHEPQEELAAKLGMSNAAVRTALFRLRERFREVLRALVRDTLHNPSTKDINEELRAMQRALLG